ncbi:MAG: C-type lectin domain-containing protein [Kofleriaceae bacterium]
MRCLVLLAVVSACDYVYDLERPPPSCPREYGRVDGREYLRINGAFTWQEASERCETTRGSFLGYTHLAIVDDENELAAIRDEYTPTPMWLGHIDLAVEGTFVPITTQDVVLPSGTPPWNTDQPNDLDPGQDCVHLDNMGLLDDKSCTTDVFDALCECDAFPLRGSVL